MPIGPHGRNSGSVPLAEAEKSAAPSGPALDAKGAGGIAEQHEFDLGFTDRRGRLWHGKFKCHALTIRDHASIGIIQSRLANGVSVDVLDSFTRQLLLMMATLSVAVDEAPDWAKDIEKIHDVDVLNAIYEEVVAHEVRFHGADVKNSDERDSGDRSEE